MKVKEIIAAGSILVLSIFGASVTAAPQQVTDRLVHANGNGTLKVGQEQFQVTAVVVKLLNDQKAEITLISDITIFIEGKWSHSGSSQEEFDLEITGGANPGGLEGNGKLNLAKENESQLRLTLKGKSRTTKKPIEVKFVGK